MQVHFSLITSRRLPYLRWKRSRCCNLVLYHLLGFTRCLKFSHGGRFLKGLSFLVWAWARGCQCIGLSGVDTGWTFHISERNLHTLVHYRCLIQEMGRICVITLLLCGWCETVLGSTKSLGISGTVLLVFTKKLRVNMLLLLWIWGGIVSIVVNWNVQIVHFRIPDLHLMLRSCGLNRGKVVIRFSVRLKTDLWIVGRCETIYWQVVLVHLSICRCV